DGGRSGALPDEAGDVVGDRLDGVQLAGVAADGRVGRVEAVHVGQQHQQVGLDEGGDQGAQVVVVADLDLLDGHRVVLVDDRQDAEAQQGQQRVARVEVAGAVADVLGGDEAAPHLDDEPPDAA